MRTTLTLEDDVAAALEKLRKSRRQSLKSLVNEALREGLRRMSPRNKKRAPFRTGTADLGRCLLVNVDNVTEVLALAEAESFK